MMRAAATSLLLAGLLIGCGDDKATDSADGAGSGGAGSGSGTTDTDTPSGSLVHESGFALTIDDIETSATRTSTATYAVDVTSEGVSGFISYSETDGAGAEACSAVFNVRTVLPDAADAAACADCDFGHFVQTDVSSTDGVCTFPSALVALDQAPSFDRTFVDLVFSVHDDGTTLRVSITEGEAAVEVPMFAAGTATFDGTSLLGTNEESTPVLNYWDGVCVDGGSFTQYATMIPGELALSDNLSCPDGVSDGTTVYDTWEREVDHGKTVTAAVRSPDQSVFLYLLGPDDCITAPASLAESCTGSASAYCQSIERLAINGGPYTAVVEGPCSGDGPVYEFDARIF